MAPVSLGPTEEELKAAEELKLAKQAKALAREEADRKRREDKERQAAEEQKRKEKDKEEQLLALQAAGGILSSGLKGGELVELIGQSQGSLLPTGAALLREILERSSSSDVDDVLAGKWWTKAEYGPALIRLLGESVDNQKRLLFEVQGYCHQRKFPKVEVKGQQRKLIEVLFNLLLSNLLVSADAFFAWADEDSDTPGRTDAIVHTTQFIQSLRDALAEAEEDEEEEEDDEVDAPRQIVK